jgi:hypothetical protein
VDRMVRGCSSPLERIPSEPKSSDSNPLSPLLLAALHEEAAVSAGSTVPNPELFTYGSRQTRPDLSVPREAETSPLGPRHFACFERPPPGSRAHADGVPDRAASRRGSEPKMLQILVRASP